MRHIEDERVLLAYLFAQAAHKGQKRKYTEKPYFEHCLAVAETTNKVLGDATHEEKVRSLCVAMLHDVVEDTTISIDTITTLFGGSISSGVMWLTDVETGNRSTRKRLAKERLSRAPGWVQTIKVADLIDNTSSIVEHDPKFAKVYLQEKRELLEVLTGADKSLLSIAKDQLIDQEEILCM